MQCGLTLTIDILRALPLTRRPGQMKGKGRVIYQRGLEKHFDLHSPHLTPRPPPRPPWAVQNESLSLLAAPPPPTSLSCSGPHRPSAGWPADLRSGTAVRLRGTSQSRDSDGAALLPLILPVPPGLIENLNKQINHRSP